MAVMSRQDHQHTALAVEHQFPALPEHLFQPAIPCAPDRRLGAMGDVFREGSAIDYQESTQTGLLSGNSMIADTVRTV